ncbi:hypothetical protein [Desulfovibrio ferrophilus]|uniref:Sulfotransferase domain-containing protein n=1 Tax=Desulfovibrio ferrophilus TaxID=241368 RepID=A0A2Z6B1E1_9BACT|nr:hypothetical protein [Desulfovibrio ferrophilus]BBD09285.1 uncharacterized protein DFE_2559 [Desulfovibrio ferrophilus]
MKTVYLHIGYFKTGTTALQHFLWHNRDALAEQGVLYPETGCLEQNGHVHLVSSIFQKHGHKIPVWLNETFKPEAIWSALRAEIDSSDCQDIVLSNEHFCSFCHNYSVEPLLAELGSLLEGYNVKIISYLRRIDDYILSWYNQIIKMGNCTISLNRYIDLLLGRRDHHLYHGRILNLFAGQYEQENIIVRLYDRDHLKDGDVVADFMSLFGVDAGEFSGREQSLNSSLAPEYISLRQHLNVGWQSCDTGRYYHENVNDVLRNMAQMDADANQGKIDVEEMLTTLWPHITEIAERYCPEYLSLYDDRLAVQEKYEKISSGLDQEQQQRFVVSSMSMLCKENAQLKLEIRKLRADSDLLVAGLQRQTSQLNELTKLFTRALGSGMQPPRRTVSHLTATGS